MKIFVKDLPHLPPGDKISVEVEPRDTIAVVKRKLQDNHSFHVENQGLFFGWKLLLDKNTLEDYNIGKLSTLELRLRKTAQPKEDILAEKVEECKSNSSAETVLVASKIVDDLEEKKILHNKLKEEKNKILESIIIIERKCNSEANFVEDFPRLIGSTEKEIEASWSEIDRKKQEIRKLEENVSKNLKKKEKMRKSLIQERLKREKRKKEISGLYKHIDELDHDMKQVFTADDENKIVEENNKMKEEKSVLKTFLLESIAKKESLLECPVCLNTACPPIYKCPGEHLICCNCLPRLKGKCPMCRTNIGSDKIFRLAEENYHELQKMKAMMEI